MGGEKRGRGRGEGRRTAEAGRRPMKGRLHQRWVRRLTVVRTTPGVLVLFALSTLTLSVCADTSANGGSRVLSSSPYHTGHENSFDSYDDEAHVVVVHVHSGDLRVAKKWGTLPESERLVEAQPPSPQPPPPQRPVFTDNNRNGRHSTDADGTHVDLIAHLVVALDPTAPAGAYALTHHPIINNVSSYPCFSAQLPNRQTRDNFLFLLSIISFSLANSPTRISPFLSSITPT